LKKRQARGCHQAGARGRGLQGAQGHRRRHPGTGRQAEEALARPPQGDKLIRKEDHAGIVDCYISRVENGKLEVKRRVPKEEFAANMPLRHNLSALPV
jgi:hypothetical protein